MSQPFRFVHASDLHLERPLAGLAETPAHLGDLLIDAPYAAAERVFDLAASERADFLVLAGDIVHVERAGPRAVAFLLDHFERLAARHVTVYWAGGEAERRGPWPAELKLPDNVRVFPAGAAQPIIHLADGEALAVLIGRASDGNPSRAARSTKGRGGARDEFSLAAFARPKGAKFAIGVVHGRVGGKQLAKSGIDYWACGGEHRRRLVGSGGSSVVYPGSPQGRSPAERGPHGAVVVEVDEHGAARPRFVATDLARFRRLRVELDPSAPQADHERVLAERLQAELSRAAGLDLFLKWQIVPTVGKALRTSREAWALACLRWLRQEFGTDSPAAWSISVEVASSKTRDAANSSPQDGSLLADFLAAIGDFEGQDDELPINAMLPEPQRAGVAADLVRIADARDRRRVLRQARQLGRDLLGAEESWA